MNPDYVRHIESGLIWYLILCASIALHEYGHAKMADKLGDYLPRSQGRVTLNPFAHLDPIGTGLIPLMQVFFPTSLQIIGWGRPVEVSLPNVATRRRDDILITLAGPAMNALIALGTTLLHALAWHLQNEALNKLSPLFDQVTILNCMLIAFNLLPIPPLDGSRIMRHFIGMSEATYQRLASMSWIVLIILINLAPFQYLIMWMTERVATPYGMLLGLLTR